MSTTPRETQRETSRAMLSYESDTQVQSRLPGGQWTQEGNDNGRVGRDGGGSRYFGETGRRAINQDVDSMNLHGEVLGAMLRDLR